MRLLPWFQEAVRRDPSALALLTDCEKCMKTQNRETRQGMGCGYESPGQLNVMPWIHGGMKKPETEKRFPTTCAGYTTKLPDVIEVSRARAHWDKGSLGAFYDEKPTEALMLGIEVLDIQAHELQSWLMKPAKDGGGGS